MLILLLLAAAPARGHITANPRAVPAGAFVRLDFRVPNERPTDTVGVRISLPEDVSHVRIKPVPGWSYRLERQGDRITAVEFSGGRIQPPEFQEFSLSMKLPARSGRVYFPAVQTYEGGEVVEWTMVPDGDRPAPHVELTPAGSPAPAPRH